ncbi:MAG: hypothetical protein JSS16_13635 [Proteobacteria bacterium]|nr:hypothetical protein [Pseudomonadota bacterium]
MRRSIRCLLPGLIATVLSPHTFACSACGCTLSSDWASQGLTTTKGWRFDARFDFFDQDQLREGGDGMSRAAVAIPNEREVQQYTTNRNYTFALDYSPGSDWGVGVALPWFNRSHGTIAAGDDAVSASHDQGIGDVRVLAHYSGFDAQRDVGIETGLKLATGSFDRKFERGPQQGETVDRGLQLGTGTTDLLLGIYHFGAFNAEWGYFGQALLQVPLNSRENFKPGAGLNLNAGLRYTANETFVPQLQVNARLEKRERGANADVDNSGATLIYLSPGVTWNFSRRFSAYTFAQLPLHQRVNGLQIEARWSASVGLHYIF